MPARQFFLMSKTANELRRGEMLEWIDVAAIPMAKLDWYKMVRTRYLPDDRNDVPDGVRELMKPKQVSGNEAHAKMIDLFSRARMH